MGNRRRSRELAMQALFYMDMHQHFSKELLASFSDNFNPSKKLSPFFTKLAEGVLDFGSEIDSILIRFSNNWKMSRMSCVDRNILRIAVYEILYCEDIPPKVSINEAIDIGKKFGAEDSGAFINGILDSVRIALEESKIDDLRLHGLNRDAKNIEGK